jgi:hypothetical protein
LASQEAITIPPHNAFNVAIVDTEKKALHCWWMWKLLDDCLPSMSILNYGSYLVTIHVMTWSRTRAKLLWAWRSKFHLNFFFARTSKLRLEEVCTTTNTATKQTKSRSTMGVFVLTETSAGFALFKAKDSKIFKKGDVSADVETAEGINGL